MTVHVSAMQSDLKSAVLRVCKRPYFFQKDKKKLSKYVSYDAPYHATNPLVFSVL